MLIFFRVSATISGRDQTGVSLPGSGTGSPGLCQGFFEFGEVLVAANFSVSCFCPQQSARCPAGNHFFFFAPQFDVVGRFAPVPDGVFYDVGVQQGRVEG